MLIRRCSCDVFFPTKLCCYGDGGAIFTNDDRLLKLVKSIRVHGQGINKYDNVEKRINGRLDTIQATILIEKLKIFKEEIMLRNKVAEYYKNNQIVLSNNIFQKL